MDRVYLNDQGIELYLEEVPFDIGLTGIERDEDDTAYTTNETNSFDYIFKTELL